MENLGRLGEYVWYEGTSTKEPTLVAAQLLPSTVRWTAAAAQHVTFDLSEAAPLGTSWTHVVTLRVAGAGMCPQGPSSTVLVRIPVWAGQEPARFTAVSFNDQPLDVVTKQGAGALVGVRRSCWREGDALRLALPLTLRAEPAPGSSREGLHALVLGPVVLAWLAASVPVGPDPVPRVLGAAAGARARAALVPLSVNARLRSLVGRAGTIVHDATGRAFLWTGHTSEPAASASRPVGRGGTDLANAATFGEVTANAPGSFLVALAAFSRPGCFLALPDLGTTTANALPVAVRCDVAPSAAAAQWLRRDGFVPGLAHYAYESKMRPGLFLSGLALDTTVPGEPERRASWHGGLWPLWARTPPPRQGQHYPPTFARMSTFASAPPLATFPPGSVWFNCGPTSGPPEVERGRELAALGNTTALLMPLNEMVDEHYSVFARFSCSGDSGKGTR